MNELKITSIPSLEEHETLPMRLRDYLERQPRIMDRCIRA